MIQNNALMRMLFLIVAATLAPVRLDDVIAAKKFSTALHSNSSERRDFKELKAPRCRGLFDKQRIFREFEALHPVRLQRKCPPNAADQQSAGAICRPSRGSARASWQPPCWPGPRTSRQCASAGSAPARSCAAIPNAPASRILQPSASATFALSIFQLIYDSDTSLRYSAYPRGAP